MKALCIGGLEKALKGVRTLEEVFGGAKRTEQDSEIEIVV